MSAMPGIGLIKRRLETEQQAVALATSHILKEYDLGADAVQQVSTLETKYDKDSGDWYVALGWGSGSDAKRAVIRMDSILGTVIDTQEL